ncbi:glycogen/starch/alpha-glucan phosphorylase [Pseudorhodoferax sp. Leaf265]|uniref:glycogen/starch/alpha-glucan phosphorylase n=1 Tax=Pseudorhodoferax sp. Leaf265 TaxID=1736315 RepID=UPI0006FACD89|nr:glycogen/starch/alpha-glucan phosphorylase [Pseudorhodoferax sp. Leaf265]KQP02094.1 maltodextrin phosphorylase [Pseudorhodoferax sp. Leaf265]PZP96185.1 MAG: glycogen/starch/alpha-glucan phosphorylase [Variovorax paradoxus]PZQ07170.1 MAG: glycogen/starch/alpha-glucan phosphorylase [Variovorax paradoxus]
MSPTPSSHSFAARTEEHLLHTVGVAPAAASSTELMHAVSQAARAELSQRWVQTQAADRGARARRVYYLSMEFLIGRTLSNALAALGQNDGAAEALGAHAKAMEEVADHEPDAALGNGGLGRLAACFLDSMASLGLPSFGYGIRYEYGMFAQEIQNGAQVEHPDPWLKDGTPWEFPRWELSYPVRFGGWVEHVDGKAIWRPAAEVAAKAYDMVIPGHGTKKVSTLRLWKATAPAHIDLNAFNTGDYQRAATAKNEYENISWVLYPNDSTPAGRELRLKQEYFFVAASIQDMVKRHLDEHGTLSNLADQVAIHLNDTHPAIGVAELMRVLCDEHGMDWTPAWAICRRTFSYTNHTLMPEALETWPVGLMQHVLPRHLEIIFRINKEFLDFAAQFRPGDNGFLSRLSLIDEAGERRVRMANLSIVGSHKVNGVSKLHSDLLVQTIFADFAALWPERFTNMTNGVTPRRWLSQANPGLSSLLDRHIGHGWRRDLDELHKLAPLAGNPEVRAEFMEVKRANKARLAALIARTTGVQVNPDALFDVQVKRIHEYKRQLLNVLHVIGRYQAILANPKGPDGQGWVPRVVLFAGKAASSYHMAKNIIRLIHDAGRVINNDPRVGDLLKLVFIPNYGVSVAETIMPGADLSEQISTAGTEASGTGNMKLALNGALTIGTDDGANIEIREAVGDANIFIFGLKTPEVQALRASGYQPMRHYEGQPDLKAVLDAITGGQFSPEEPGRYRGLVDALLWGGDHYMLLADYASYVATQREVDALYREPAAWCQRAIANVAGMGVFSSDRTIREYARQIWRIEPKP